MTAFETGLPTGTLILRMAAVAAGFVFLFLLVRKFADRRVTVFTLLFLFFGTNLVPSAVCSGPWYGSVLFVLYSATLNFSLDREGNPRRAWFLLLLPAAWLVHCFFFPAEAGDHAFGIRNIHRILFSAENGWLVYTPLVVPGFAGFYFLAERNRPVFLVSFIILVLSVAFAAGFSEAWQGPGPGTPFLTENVALLALPLALLIGKLSSQGAYGRILLTAGSALLVLCTLFISWQKYHGNFGQSPGTLPADSIPEGVKLQCKKVFTFEYSPAEIPGTSGADNRGLLLDSSRQYSPGLLSPLAGLTGGDSCWIRASGSFFLDNGPAGIKGYLVVTCLRDGKAYKYNVTDLSDRRFSRGLNHVTMGYRLPSQAGPGDYLQVYFMNFGKRKFYISTLDVERCIGKP